MSEDIKRLTLRIPIKLYKDVEKLAEDDKRNINNYITVLLEQHIKLLKRKEL